MRAERGSDILLKAGHVSEGLSHLVSSVTKNPFKPVTETWLTSVLLPANSSWIETTNDRGRDQIQLQIPWLIYATIPDLGFDWNCNRTLIGSQPFHCFKTRFGIKEQNANGCRMWCCQNTDCRSDSGFLLQLWFTSLKVTVILQFLERPCIKVLWHHHSEMHRSVCACCTCGHKWWRLIPPSTKSQQEKLRNAKQSCTWAR